MASITKLPSGAYRVQIRRKGRYASETFLRRNDAHRWARQAETRVDQGLAPNKSSVSRLQTFADLIDLHITDMCEVGKPPRHSTAATLTTLKRDLSKEKIGLLDRQKLIDYGKMRADQGAGPVTLGIDIGVIKMVITHAAAAHGLDISPLYRENVVSDPVFVRGRLPDAILFSRIFLCLSGFMLVFRFGARRPSGRKPATRLGSRKVTRLGRRSIAGSASIFIGQNTDHTFACCIGIWLRKQFGRMSRTGGGPIGSGECSSTVTRPRSILV
ncbi:hypothetical protein [Ponticoccus alexandrii]|uniref:hypothetical protein n=1 Tax=Ponticoccus alexandrii TaxID=1943633 RepID=UPI0003D1ADD3|nr:hypothetical protein [Ponticoccus alexandrii]